MFTLLCFGVAKQINAISTQAFLEARDPPPLDVRLWASSLSSVSWSSKLCREIPNCRRLIYPTTYHEILFEKEWARSHAMEVSRSAGGFCAPGTTRLVALPEAMNRLNSQVCESP